MQHLSSHNGFHCACEETRKQLERLVKFPQEKLFFLIVRFIYFYSGSLSKPVHF